MRDVCSNRVKANHMESGQKFGQTGFGLNLTDIFSEKSIHLKCLLSDIVKYMSQMYETVRRRPRCVL